MLVPMAKVRLRESIAQLPAYVPGARPDGAMVEKLSSNENPFPPLPGVVAAVSDAAADLNRYPDLAASRLVGELATRFALEPDHVVVGNGSVAVLETLLHALLEPGDEVVYAWRSFEAYPIAVAVAGGISVPVPLTADARHDLPAMAAAVTERTKAVIVCSPNNPTGTAATHGEVRDLLDALPEGVLVLLDEAYVEFVRGPERKSANRADEARGEDEAGLARAGGDRAEADANEDDHGNAAGDHAEGVDNGTHDDATRPLDALALLRADPRVVVLRTFSKAYGLAGLRVGYALARPRIAKGLRAAGTPFGVNALAQVAAVESLRAETELFARVQELVEERERMVLALRAAGWDIPEAQGNFVWFPVGERTGLLAEAFSRAGLIVRPFAGDGVRVSIGDPEANDAVIVVATEFLATQ
ncbi:MAG: hypothetical protein BGO96_02425 [Micrococcales bacterium 73-15]|nr:MAG: hypothetical protein BGO96_02425 [Micrococcales bacterium 73-15]